MPGADAVAAVVRDDDRTEVVAADAPAPDAMTAAGAVLGTPAYMPPEAWLGEPATPASDVYALGVVLFELVVGATPHKGTPLEQLPARVVDADAPAVRSRAPDVPPALATIIDRCLARAPAARFRDGDELRDALEAVAAAGREGAVPDGNPYRGLAAVAAGTRALVVILEEVKPETTYLDALAVEFGGVRVAPRGCAAGGAACAADGAPEVFTLGERRRFVFDVPAGFAGAPVLFAHGYYQPFAPTVAR